MNKLFLVIKREYLTRVRTKSFIIITLFTPFLLFSIVLLPIYFAHQYEDYKKMKIGLVDPTFMLKETYTESELDIEYLEDKTIKDIKNLVLSNQWEGIVYLKKNDSTSTNIQYYSTKQPSISLLNQIRSEVQKKIINERLSVFNIPDINAILNAAKESIRIESIKVGTEDMQTSNSSYQRGLCLLLGVAIYLFILLFSSQVMRGVLEEKSNRIVELIITSISPVKFMAGKIIGIALLGVTQLICWMVIIFSLSLFITDWLSEIPANDLANKGIRQEDITQILNNINLIDFNIIIPAFLFFFICGYLLYSSLFACIAATVNYSDEIQQVTLILTTPLILSVFVLSNTVNSSDSSLSYWFSIIPFTSPIVMTGRLVYGVPAEDILLSMTLLITTVALIIWLSGKVYKTTILYSGKKISIKELISRIRNNNL